MALVSDEEPCVSRVVVAVSGVTHLVGIDRAADEQSALTPFSNLVNAVAVTVDQPNGFMFFTDVISKHIWRKDFKTAGARSEIIRTLSSGEFK